VNRFQHIWATYCQDNGFSSSDGAGEDEELFVIAMDSGHLIVVEEEPSLETVLVKALLAYLPLDDDDVTPIYRQLLEAHLLGEATGGASFAIDPDEDELIAYRRLPAATLDARRLATEISELATTAMRFADMLQLPAPAKSIA
jgi:hypothetical protein